MAIIFSNEICQLHPPKCGGRSITAALNDHTPDEGPVYDGHAHSLPSKWDYPVMFTTVREPAAWLRSFWSHRKRNRWGVNGNKMQKTPYAHLVRMTDPHRSDDFDRFADSVTANLGGIIGWFFGVYSPPPVQVVKIEMIAPFLEKLGVNRKNIVRLGASPNLPKITESTRGKIVEAEMATYLRYGYLTE